MQLHHGYIVITPQPTTSTFWYVHLDFLCLFLQISPHISLTICVAISSLVFYLCETIFSGTNQVIFQSWRPLYCGIAWTVEEIRIFKTLFFHISQFWFFVNCGYFKSLNYSITELSIMKILVVSFCTVQNIIDLALTFIAFRILAFQNRNCTNFLMDLSLNGEFFNIAKSGRW